MSYLPSLSTVGNLALLAIGFGFVVFWHELGHFLAAKWAGVKVEQFAVGFGHALFSWRKGIGFRVGNTQKEYQKRLGEYFDANDAKKQQEELRLKEKADAPALTDKQVAEASKALGLGETEYRLNWIPLGGYVKMLGQDDLKPNAEADDPRAFNRQTIGKRMVIVSAGVVMNVILAAIGFMVLFLYGFHVPPAMVGAVSPGSPAQVAGILPGDEILTIDGKAQHNDWTKVQLNAALCASNEPVVIEVERVVNGEKKVITLKVTPARGGLAKEFLGFGIAPPPAMHTLTLKEAKEDKDSADEAKNAQLISNEYLALKPGEVITEVEGAAVPPSPGPNDDRRDRSFLILNDALQRSNGKPIKVTVRGNDGKGESRTLEVQPHFQEPFSADQVSFGGMVPRLRVIKIGEDSSAFGKLLPNDVITAIRTSAGGGSELANPSLKAFHQRLDDVGKSGGKVDLTVLREGKDGKSETKQINGLNTIPISRDNYGLGIGIEADEMHTVVADVQGGSSAQKAQVPAGATILQVAGQPVASWFDVETQLRQWLKDHPAAAGSPLAPVPVVYRTEGGQEKNADLELNQEEADAIQSYRYQTNLPLDAAKTIRKTGNPAEAAVWGVWETRDFILQFYVTLHRMVTRDVSPKNLMGPLGIFQAGTTFAAKGYDWLLWFLAMISANLAVVNFLPIPIVDGGLFTFLVLEKIKGRPLSPKTQAIAQYVGMALLLGVFLFVTWQDVFNFKFRMR